MCSCGILQHNGAPILRGKVLPVSHVTVDASHHWLTQWVQAPCSQRRWRLRSVLAEDVFDRGLPVNEVHDIIDGLI